MKAEFKKVKHFCLIEDSEEKTIAIIRCEEGFSDITNKITLAIKEDRIAELVTIDHEDTVLSDEYELTFTADVIDEDGEQVFIDYTLSMIEIY